MITSRDRILTTHVGSLPRNEKLSDLLVRREASETFDAAEMTSEMDKAVRHVVEQQKKPGSISATTASSSASVFRPTCRNA
jgi:Methionine synthase II (cobalamin-independent)